MKTSRTVRLMIVVLLLALVGACADDQEETAVTEEGTFAVRPYEAVSGDRWIGEAICYGPHRDGQHPEGVQPSREEIREDLHIMAKHWSLVRIYGASAWAETMFEVIREDGLDMKVMLGAWIGTEGVDGGGKAEDNRLEIEAAIRLANAYPDIVTSVCVGNETQVDWSGHRSPLEVVIRYIREVRSQVTVPVTNADDFGYWIKPESRALSAELDFVTTHAHPLWNGIQLEDGMAWMIEQVEAVQALHADRPVVIGETGWATSSADVGEQATLIKGTPGEAEQKIFCDAAVAWAKAERMPTFLFEAFDENWKGGSHPDEVEKHWGLYNTDRTPKAAIRD